MSWPIVKLEDVVLQQKGSLVSGPFGSNISAKYFVDEGIPVIRGNNLTKGGQKFIDDGFAYLTEQKASEFSNCIAIKGDIIFTAAGSIGQVGIIPEESKYPKYVISNKQLRARIDRKKADPLFLYYWLSSRQMIRWLEGMNNGGAVPLLNLGIVRKVPVPLPTLEKQQRIASIITAYDNLIENNRRRIQLLEQAARLLYKEWFVHLRFPGHEHVNIKDGVPEGWEKKTYADLFQFLGGFAFKSKTYLTDGRYGVVTIKNVHDARFVPECPSRLDAPPEKMKEHCLLKTGDILLSLTGNVGRACIVYGADYLLNQRVAKVVGKPGIPVSFVYWTFSNDMTQKELENLAYGVAQLNLSPVKLGEREFIEPPRMILDLFADTAQPIFSQICTLNLQN